MRLNQFVARASGLSRRAADQAITSGRITVNGQMAGLGQSVDTDDQVKFDDQLLSLRPTLTIMLNKPTGYICSRTGQGGKTIYELLPAELHDLKPVGRLDKDSSGLLLLTNDGQLAQELTHPSNRKSKIYEVRLNKEMTLADLSKINRGVKLEDGISHLAVKQTGNSEQETAAAKRKLFASSCLLVTMAEGRNRQIRRTFAALDYTVTKLHRVQFGPYRLDSLKTSQFIRV